MRPLAAIRVRQRRSPLTRQRIRAVRPDTARVFLRHLKQDLRAPKWRRPRRRREAALARLEASLRTEVLLLETEIQQKRRALAELDSLRSLLN